MRKRVNRRDLLLGSLFVLSCFLALKSSSDRSLSWLRGTFAEPLLRQFSTGNQMTSDIAVGVIVGLFVWLLVVRLPEEDKRKRVRRNLQLQYDSFKRECIRIFLDAMGEAYDPALIDTLKDQEQFRQFFSSSFDTGQSRWDAVANGLDAEAIRGLTVEFEVLIGEVRFTLTAIDVENPALFAFLKQLANGLYRARKWSSDYDSIKSLLSLMWSVFAGWSLVEGYAERDVIASVIESI